MMRHNPCTKNECLVVSACPYSYEKMRDYYLYLIKAIKEKRSKELRSIISTNVYRRLKYIIDNHFNLQIKSECGWAMVISPYTEKVIEVMTAEQYKNRPSF